LLNDWHTDNAPAIAPLAGTESNPMKRLSVTLSTQLNKINVRLSCAFSIQYSCKKYYKFDGSIRSLQEALSKIDGEINSVNLETEKRIWSEVKEELKKRGFPVEDENYITQVSRNENYLYELLSDFMDLGSKYEPLLKQKESKIVKLKKKKERVARNLEKFVIEANITEPVLLDELGVSTRSRGLFVYLDMHNSKTGADMPRDNISNETASRIEDKFREIERGLNELTLH